MIQKQFVDLKDLTDRCVKCAVCLPACPTWRQTRDEAESPRGRIAMIEGVIDGAISAAEAAPHISSCLACRSCETVCPAAVPYGLILDRGRDLLAQSGARAPRSSRFLARLLASRFALRIADRARRMAATIPVRTPGHGIWSRILAMPGPAARPSAANVYRTAQPRGRVALMRGCVSGQFDGASNDAIGALLTRCGYDVDVIAGCCGALYQHQGDLGRAAALASARAADLAGTDYAAVLHAASGCAAAMRDWAAYSDDPAVRAAAAGVVDVFTFLRAAGLAELQATGDRKQVNVALHLPCTQRNVTGGAGALRALLGALPGVEVTTLHGDGCCGAAGSHMLTRRAQADRLADTLLNELDQDTHPPTQQDQDTHPPTQRTARRAMDGHPAGTASLMDTHKPVGDTHQRAGIPHRPVPDTHDPLSDTHPPAAKAATVTVLTANIGCAWHLRAALARRGQPIAVLHPARFLVTRLGVTKAGIDPSH